MKPRPIRIAGDVAYVPLTSGYEAVIDSADVHLVAGCNWHASVKRRKDGSIRTVYARRQQRIGDRQKPQFMHRVIDQTPDGFETDHRDGNGLNNRRMNLRTATTAQNQHNRSGDIKGAFWRKRRHVWGASIRVHGKRIDLGSFRSEEEAASAYRAAKAKLHGEFSRSA